MAAKINYILEMTTPDEFQPKDAHHPVVRVEKMDPPFPEFNKFLHATVGYDYQWGGRTEWGQKEWYDYVNRDELETWVMYHNGNPAGYFELVKHANGDIQIDCFGLLPHFIGKGFGGFLLTKTIQRAWELAEGKVFLHTCSNDHPHALNNYQARGFKIVRKNEGSPTPPVKSFWEIVENSLPA